MKNQDIANQTDIVKIYHGVTIRIREDRYVCFTDMAKANNRKVAQWLLLSSTKTYMEALSQVVGFPTSVLLEVGHGTPTWGHPKLAIRFAQWCSESFAVQVDFWIDELISTGKVSIAPPEPAIRQPEPRQLAPQRDVLDYVNGMVALGIGNDPLLRALITQRMAEELGAAVSVPSKVGDEPEQVIVTIRAGQLGYSQKQIGNGSALGTFVKKQHEPVGQTCHGKYEVNVYALTPELDLTIADYFALQELKAKSLEKVKKNLEKLV